MSTTRATAWSLDAYCWSVIAVGVLVTFALRPLTTWFTPLVVLLLFPACAAGTLAVYVVALLRLRFEASRPSARRVLAALSVYILAWWFGSGRLASVGDDVYTERWLLPRYEALLPRVLVTTRSTTRRFTELDGERFAVDEGPPRRVAFLQSGFLDNWGGIVHDPSGAVAQATGWRYDTGQQEYSAPPGIRGVFGGDLVSCHHLRGSWYRCSFT